MTPTTATYVTSISSFQRFEFPVPQAAGTCFESPPLLKMEQYVCKASANPNNGLPIEETKEGAEGPTELVVGTSTSMNMVCDLSWTNRRTNIGADYNRKV